jgi:DNA-binding CsgD family transcriptional regulator
MLTVYEDEERVFESIRNGACGYVFKRTLPHSSSRPCARPPVAISRWRRDRATHRPNRADEEGGEPVADPSSPRELALLRLLADGHSDQSSADNLEITINTVRDYVQNICEKLHVHSQSEAVSQGLRRQAHRWAHSPPFPRGVRVPRMNMLYRGFRSIPWAKQCGSRLRASFRSSPRRASIPSTSRRVPTAVSRRLLARFHRRLEREFRGLLRRSLTAMAAGL